MPNHESHIQQHRTSPREMGKRAYKNGRQLNDNPFPAHSLKDVNARKEWAEGWLYQRTHYPSARDAMESESDTDCLSPWQGNDSGYDGHW